MVHYLDNSATTPLCAEARDAIINVYDNACGNPSSLHTDGVIAHNIIDKSRKIILGTFIPPALRGKPEQIIFTSGGTESNNLAVIGTAMAKPKNSGKKIIIGQTEHASVYASAKHLETLGFKVVYIPSPHGVWDTDMFKSELTEDTILVSAMLVNNETGAINDISSIAEEAHRINPQIIVHCDAVQGYLRLPRNLFSKADIVSVSAHKIGGPKGAGALFISENALKAKAVSPVLFGGGQEHGIRSGTENVAGIAGFAAAVDYYNRNSKAFSEHFKELRAYTETAIASLSELGIRINKPATVNTADHIISITVPGIKSETLLHFLSSEDIYVSSGSACSSNKKSHSRSLISFGLTEDEADSTVRISLGVQNTASDIDALVSAFGEGFSELQRKRI